ncbi:MAG: diguanylate cyclase [Acidobacteriia bacterium]|nr:diguanylate cyclase [Terriglobia bacterium]
MLEQEPQHKILIVDDDVRLAQSLEPIVKSLGLTPRVVHSGYDAQKLLLIENFELIVADLVMPGITGFDLIDFARLRNLRAPIVVLTGEATVESAVRALRHGAYDFVVKPFEPEHFKMILMHALERSVFEQKRREQATLSVKLQEEIQQSKHYLELVLQSAEDVAIVTTNREGRVKTFNRGAEKLWALPAEQGLGQTIDAWLNDPELVKVAREFLSQKRRDVWREEMPLQNHRGEIIWMHVVMRWMESGSPSLTGLILVATDITQRALLREKLQLLSITDDLTGLYNQRYFYEVLHRELERAHRRNSIFSLSLFDIDRFKQFNDQFGHLKGDAILRSLGSVVLSSVRAIDFAFRYGGDEFAVLLPETSMENARNTVERIRANVESEFQDQVTISIGLVEGHSHSLDRDLVEEADRAMYEAKRAGGNSVFEAKFYPPQVQPQ